MAEQGMDMMRFDLPKDRSSIIKVIGVGGGGSNAVNYMYEHKINGVDFIVCNTDNQALDKSIVPTKIQLGATLTEGRGAGSIPEVGKNAAVESLEEIKEILSNNTTMVFVTAGMGGGTGTGAAPIIARAAREMGILTVGIVTVPFQFEGKKRMNQAELGLEEMRDAVDTLLVIKNDKLRELYGNLSIGAAFSHADEVLCTAAKGIAEVITLTGEINVDMNDVNTVMRQSGVAIMGSGRASGEDKAQCAVMEALESPLLNDNDITGANFVLLNITYGSDEILMDEITEITDYIQDQAGMNAEVIWGYGPDDSLGEDICVTVIATGFHPHSVDAGLPVPEAETRKFDLDGPGTKELTETIQSPTQNSPINPETSKKDQNFEEELEPFILPKNENEPSMDGMESIEIDMDKMDIQEINPIESSLQNSDPNPANESLNQSDLFNQNPGDESSQQIPMSVNSEQPEEKEESHRYDLFEDSLETTTPPKKVVVSQERIDQETTVRPSREKVQELNRKREEKIKEITNKLKTPSGISDLENEPAFVRRKVELDNIKHSSESTASRYSLNEELDENGNKKIRLKDDNSFLHDNVD